MGKLLLVGCGKMGGAMLDGWLARGLAAEDVIRSWAGSFMVSERTGPRTSDFRPQTPDLRLRHRRLLDCFLLPVCEKLKTAIDWGLLRHARRSLPSCLQNAHCLKKSGTHTWWPNRAVGLLSFTSICIWFMR